MIRNRKEFINYCLRKLGHGVWEIEVTEEQIEDCVDDAISEFEERHGEGGEREYLTIQLTQDDIDSNRFVLPDNVIQVMQVLNSGPVSMGHSVSSGGAFPMFNAWANTFAAGPLMKRGFMYYGVQNYVIWQSYLETINQTLTPVKHFRYNQNSHILHLDFPMSEGMIVAIAVRVELDDNALTNLFNNAWLKSYCTALIKKQWGENMTKYTVDLGSNGVEVNGQQKLDEANVEIAQLIEDLREKYVNSVIAMKG